MTMSLVEALFGGNVQNLVLPINNVAFQKNDTLPLHPIQIQGRTETVIMLGRLQARAALALPVLFQNGITPLNDIIQKIKHLSHLIVLQALNNWCLAITVETSRNADSIATLASGIYGAIHDKYAFIAIEIINAIDADFPIIAREAAQLIAAHRTSHEAQGPSQNPSQGSSHPSQDPTEIASNPSSQGPSRTPSPG